MDTLKYFEELRATGLNELTAKAHVYALQSNLTGMATKEDLHNEISGLETRINSRIDTLRTLGWALFGAFLLPIIKLAFWP